MLSGFHSAASKVVGKGEDRPGGQDRTHGEAFRHAIKKSNPPFCGAITLEKFDCINVKTVVFVELEAFVSYGVPGQLPFIPLFLDNQTNRRLFGGRAKPLSETAYVPAPKNLKTISAASQGGGVHVGDGDDDDDNDDDENKKLPHVQQNYSEE
ncbi:hypothetical protein RUM44_013168 [Polyplax serrata]|uniref:Uncharacterized protein n=1 Tax=Polyplax serrata TaxID=468196 RepID=A0ABR1BDE3_POLSC